MVGVTVLNAQQWLLTIKIITEMSERMEKLPYIVVSKQTNEHLLTAKLPPPSGGKSHLTEAGGKRVGRLA